MLLLILFISAVPGFVLGGYGTYPSGGRCSADPDPGPCRGSCTRWYFDPSDYKCKKFTYGCCGGNHNNYRSRKECLDVCNDGCGDGTNPDSVRCIVGACTIQTCPNYPRAYCIPRCNSCFSQFIYRGRDVTRNCHRK